MEILILGWISSYPILVYQLSYYLNESKPDLAAVHDDRPETLAGSISASFNNILVGHIEVR